MGRRTLEDWRELFDEKGIPHKIVGNFEYRLSGRQYRPYADVEFHPCGHVHNASLNHVYYNGTGCRICGKRTLEDWRELFDEKGIPHRIVGNFEYRPSGVGYRPYADVEFHPCGHVHNVSLNNVHYEGSGCRECPGPRLTEEDWRKRFDELPHELLGNFEYRKIGPNTVTYGDVKYSPCGHERSVNLKSVYYVRTGCPKCADYTPDPDAPTTSYYILLREEGYLDAFMIGIRQTTHEQRYPASDRAKMTVLKKIEFDTWTEAKAFERMLIEKHKHRRATNFPPLSNKGINGKSPEIFHSDISIYHKELQT